MAPMHWRCEVDPEQQALRPPGAGGSPLGQCVITIMGQPDIIIKIWDPTQSVQSYAVRDRKYIENDMFKETPKPQLKYWTRLQAIHVIQNLSSQPTQPKLHAAGKPHHWPWNLQTQHSGWPFCVTPKMIC